MASPDSGILVDRLRTDYVVVNLVIAAIKLPGGLGWRAGRLEPSGSPVLPA
jgi:hypothetical protein